MTKQQAIKHSPFENVDPRVAKPLSGSTGNLAGMSPEAAKKQIESQALPTIWQPAVVQQFASNTASGAPSIVEITRALKNDPQLIYQFVYENIDFTPGVGVAKGAFGCLLDGIGNPFDQSALLVALLRQAGFTANLEVGVIQLTQAQVNAWLGTTPGSIWTPYYVLANASIPVSVVGTYPNEQLQITHCWVKVNIGTVGSPNWVVMDPSFKTYTTTAGINLATAMSYNQATFLTQARSGYSIDSSGNWVQNINRTNLRNQLATLSNNLITWIKANMPDAATDEIIGGRKIVPLTLPVTFAASLSYQKAGDVPTEFTGDFSTAYKKTIQIIFPGINVTLTSDQIYGRRLTWFYNASNQPELRLDGTLVATGTAQSNGSWNSIQVIVTHKAYPNTYSDQSFWLTVYAPNWGGLTGRDYYLIGTQFGPVGKGNFDYHLQADYENEYLNGEFSEPGLGECLARLWANYTAQNTRVEEIAERMSKNVVFTHHFIGLTRYQAYTAYSGSAFDVQGVRTGTAQLDPSSTLSNASGLTRAIHGYTAEMLAIQQTTSQSAIAATRALDVALSGGTKIWKGTQANWSGTVAPALSGYDPSRLNDIATYYLPYGYCALIPETSGQVFAPFTMSTQALISANGAIGLIDATKGGTGPGKGKGKEKEKEKDCEEADPVNIRTGDYLYRHTDLTIGSGTYPYCLPFETSYDSRARLTNGPLGLGWTHNWNSKAVIGSDGFRGMGSESPIAGAACIAEMYVCMDLMSDAAQPVDKLAMAHLCNQWLADSLTNNTITLKLPDDEDMVFTLLPDGTYTAPPDRAGTLTWNGTIFVHTTPQKIVRTYNASGQLTSIVFPYGVTITLTYTSGKLTSISNGMGRTLTLTYSGNYLQSVSDGTGRSVGYSVNTGTSHLTQFTDAMSGVYTFSYDAPGRLWKYFKPQNPTDACVTNTYDSLNRIKSQVDIMSHTISFYLAGSRSEIVDPVGNSTVSYYDGQHNVVKEIDALGFVTKNEYDGRNRTKKITYPEGNYKSFTYDANCNILTETEVAKAGSGLPNLVLQNTYDPLWNKVKVATDARGNATTATYNATTGTLTSVQMPVIGGLTPTISYTYNSRGQVLTETEPTGIVRKYTYDTATEKLTSVVNDYGTGRLNLTTNFGYDAVGNGTTVQDPRGYTTTHVFDNLRRITLRTESAPFSYQSQFGYDSNSNLLTLKRQTGIVATPWQTFTWTYSKSDKKKTLVDAANNTTTWSYDAADRLQSLLDAENRLTQFSYDALNRVQTVTDPTNTVSETRTYTANGKLASIKDARNNTTTYSFDGHDRPDRTTYPDATYEQNQSYDSNGNLLTYRTRSGNTIVSTYDVLNRISTKAPQGQPTVTYTYDLANRLISTSTPVVAGNPASGLHQRQFDTAGRFYKEIYPDSKAVQFVLDSNGNVTKITYPDGYYVDRTYDELNRLSTIKLNGAATAAVTFGYDQLSRRSSMTLSSGASISYTYQLNDDPNVFTHTFTGSSLALTHGYDKVHSLKSQQFSDSTYSWHPGAAGTSTYGVANNINEYPQIGGVTQTYNTNGCLTNDGVWTHTFDTENHLLTSSKSGTSLAFVYDPFHRQTQKSVTTSGTTKTRFIYSGWQLLAEYDGVSGSLQNRYVYSDSLDEPLIQVTSSGVVSFLHSNSQGSIIAKTNATGTVGTKYKYGPFGETASLSGSPFGFQGQRFDSETGLYYFKRRYYSPATGRFLQPDPIGYDINAAECGCNCRGGCGFDAVPSNLHLYGFVNNNPLSATDPMGLAAVVIAIPILVAIVLAALLFYLAWLDAKRKWEEAGCPIPKIPPIELPPIEIPPIGFPWIDIPTFLEDSVNQMDQYLKSKKNKKLRRFIRADKMNTKIPRSQDHVTMGGDDSTKGIGINRDGTWKDLNGRTPPKLTQPEKDYLIENGFQIPTGA